MHMHESYECTELYNENAILGGYFMLIIGKGLDPVPVSMVTENYVPPLTIFNSSESRWRSLKVRPFNSPYVSALGVGEHDTAQT